LTNILLEFIVSYEAQGFALVFRKKWPDVSGFAGLITQDRWAELNGLGTAVYQF